MSTSLTTVSVEMLEEMEAEIERLRAALDEVVLAWESRCCEPVEEWLAGEMKPAIDEAKSLLTTLMSRQETTK